MVRDGEPEVGDAGTGGATNAAASARENNHQDISPNVIIGQGVSLAAEKQLRFLARADVQDIAKSDPEVKRKVEVATQLCKSLASTSMGDVDPLSSIGIDVLQPEEGGSPCAVLAGCSAA